MNRQCGPTLNELMTLLGSFACCALIADVFRAQVLSLLAKAPRLHQEIATKPLEWWNDLRRVQIVLDARQVDELREDLRERIRHLRRQFVEDGSCT